MKYDFNVPIEEVEKAIDSWIFSERDRKIMKRKLLDGITFEKVAEEFDLSVRHTKTIVYRGCDKIFRHIEGRKK